MLAFIMKNDSELMVTTFYKTYAYRDRIKEKLFDSLVNIE
jgi:hypothetical protein